MPTEAEMMEKWCPHVRIAQIWTHAGEVVGGVTFNRSVDFLSDEPPPEAFRCCGSRCSQWDWYQGDLTKEGDPERQGDCGLKR